MISWGIIIISSTTFILAPYLTIIIVGFLQDLPLQKQGLLSRLCQDVSWINLMFVSLWPFSSIVFKSLEEISNDNLIRYISSFTSLAAEILFLMLILYLCFIGFLKLYITRYSSLDPIEDWLEKPEDFILMTIRLIVTILSIIELTFLCLTSVKPMTYYMIYKPGNIEESIPSRTLWLLYTDCGLLAVCAQSILAGYILQHVEDEKLQRYRVAVEMQNIPAATIEKNLQDSNKNESNPHSHQHYTVQQFLVARHVSFASLVYLVVGMIIPFVFILQYFNIISLNFWWMIIIQSGLEGVGVPILLIAKNPPVTHYALRKIREHMNLIYGLLHRCFSSCKQHNASVGSIS